jgi:hypothetical protein
MSCSMLVRMIESNMPQAFEIIGDPGWIRTSDLQLRSTWPRDNLAHLSITLSSHLIHADVAFCDVGDICY